jgi:uncharacterized membrane protein YozB (DUF420 family)
MNSPWIIFLLSFVLFYVIAAIAANRVTKGDLGGRAISFRRLFLIAFIISIVVFVILAIVAIFGLNGFSGSPSSFRGALAEMPTILLIYGLILATCLGIVAFIYLMRGLQVLERHSSESLRESMGFALLCWIPAAGTLAFSGGESLGRVLVYSLSGLSLGLLAGPLVAQRWKQNIEGDRIVLQTTIMQARSLKESLGYWKEALLIAVGAGIGFGVVFSLLRGGLDLALPWVGALLGLMMGICLYGYVWAYLYEKRAGVRLGIERVKPNKPVDS